MDKLMKIAVQLQAYDKMSRVVDQAVNKSIKKFAELQKASDKISSKAFSFGKDAGAVGLTLAAPLMYATKRAVDFEDAMADVAKVYNIKVGSDAFNKAGEDVKDLSVHLSRSADEAAALYASLGQGGVEENNLSRVSKTVGEMAVAFGITADAAGDMYTKIKNALSSTWDDTKELGDALNYLSDTQSSSAPDLLGFMTAGGAATARASGAAAKDILAMGSSVISAGTSFSETATVIDRFYKGIMKHENLRQLFMKSGGGTEGMLAVLQRGANIKDRDQNFKFFQQWGEYGKDIQAMGDRLGAIRQSINSVADSTAYADSVNKEFINRQSTAKGQMGKAWAEFDRAVLDFGTNGLPIITELLKTLRPIITDISVFMKNNRELVGTIFKVTAGMAAFSLGISSVSFAIGGVTKAFSFLMSLFMGKFQVIKWLSFNIFKLRYAFFVMKPALLKMITASWAFTASLLANPITWVVAGVLALGAGLYYAYTHCETFRAIMDGWWEECKLLIEVFTALGKVVKGVFTGNLDLMKEGLSESAKLFKDIANGGFQKAYERGYNASIQLSQINKVSSEANNSGMDVMSKIAMSQNGMGNLQRLPSFPSLTPMGTAPTAAPLIPTGSNKSSFNFSTTINLSGGATKADGERIKNDLQSVFEKSLNQYQVRKERTSYE